MCIPSGPDRGRRQREAEMRGASEEASVYLATRNIRGRAFGQEMGKCVPRIKSRPVWFDHSE